MPAGSRFKGYEDILVRDLRLSAEVVRFQRERWVLPSGETVAAAICHHGLLPETVIVSDDAGQFRVDTHALRWMHSERLVHKLVPANAGAAPRTRGLARADLEAVCRPESLETRFVSATGSGAAGAL